MRAVMNASYIVMLSQKIYFLILPKIADFGMAKLLGRDFSRVLTTMRGTLGYLAPEWIRGVAITQKG
jgi:serine/threonine protein kinase